jgi:K+-transporting ATPase ATPase C chain
VLVSTHLRANLWLLLLTVALCSVLYPLLLWGVGQAAFPELAAGSLIDEDGNLTTDLKKARGSRLIAQGFSSDLYFQPRPSHAGSKGYDASASGASNWGASNYLLRDRVARQLGTLARYRDGRLVKEDIEAWFRATDALISLSGILNNIVEDIETWFGATDARLAKAKKPGLVAQWARAHPRVVQAWVDADKTHEKLVEAWIAAHPQEAGAWRKENPGKEGPGAGDLAVEFFADHSRTRAGDWPTPGSDASWSLAAVFFDMWRHEHPQADLLEVPADMVMASGSGLDPHITKANADYQARWRMAEAWARQIVKDKKLNADEERLKEIEGKVHDAISQLIEERASAPLRGLVGVRLVNVLESNIALRQRMAGLAKTIP